MNYLRFAAAALVPLAAILPTAARAQALPTASKSSSFQVGVGGQYLNNDYSPHHDAGPLVYVDYDFLRAFRMHIGAEAEARFGGTYSPDDIGENSYLVGPRLSFRRNNLNVYGKIMVGRGTIFHNSDSNNTSSSYNLYAAGGGVEYRVKQRFNIRLIEIEQQKWPSFYPHTLSPLGISAGVAYILF